MFSFILSLHSLFRWLMLVSLLLSIVVAARGIKIRGSFPRWHNQLRHGTATIAHIQLMLGIWLYTQSAQVKLFFTMEGGAFWSQGFFAVIHILSMVAAIVLITLGSALAKRKARPVDKYRTMFRWFIAALVLIILAIPWPFSPLVQRPLFPVF